MQAPKLSFTYLLFTGLCLALAGCGPPQAYPVRGKVIIMETGLLKDGEVRLQAQANPKLIGTGKIQPDGTFSIATDKGEGLPAGIYRIAVTGPPDTSLFHDKFKDFDSADRLCNVTEREENFIMVEVNKSGR